jgi:MYXO-CTERM domain-containing protein
VPTSIKPSHCVIDGTCYAYGDINPDNSCEVCDPRDSVSKTTWSTPSSCIDGGVDSGRDTAVTDTYFTDTSIEDTSTVVDTGINDAGSDADIDASLPLEDDLPEASACGCRAPGSDHSPAGLALSALGLALVVAARRRR